MPVNHDKQIFWSRSQHVQLAGFYCSQDSEKAINLRCYCMAIRASQVNTRSELAAILKKLPTIRSFILKSFIKYQKDGECPMTPLPRVKLLEQESNELWAHPDV